jgi:sugar lactone lactonase YvrE
VFRSLYGALAVALCSLSVAVPVVDAQSLNITTLAGTTRGGGYVDAAGTNARFSLPTGAVYDSSGNLFVADCGNHVIRRVTPAGEVSTFAGAFGVAGSADGTGSAARFRSPFGIGIDPADDTIYVADFGNHTLRRITRDGVVSTLAGKGETFGTADGTGSVARFTYPRGVAVDSTGTIFVADTSNHAIRKVTRAGVVTTLAGTLRSTGSSDGFGTQAHFNFPYAVAVAPSGDLIVSDSANDLIRKVTVDGRVTTVAGTATTSGNIDATGAAARFSYPQGLTVDGDGNIFVADRDNDTIRKITPAGVVTTVAGAGRSGYNDANGTTARFFFPFAITIAHDGNFAVVDSYNQAIRFMSRGYDVATIAGQAPVSGLANGPLATASFFRPSAVAVDAAGNYYVAEWGSHTIRKITPAGTVTSVAGQAGVSGSNDGTGSSAHFQSPSALAIDANGNIFVADTFNHTIRKVTPAGVVTTVAGLAGTRGSTNGVGSAARFSYPYGIAIDNRGMLYVADADNNMIRTIDQAGVVTTFAGSLTGSYVDGVGTDAEFYEPVAVAVDAQRNVYVADWYNEAIRKITPAGVVTTLAGSGQRSGSLDANGKNATFSSPSSVAVDGNGNVYVADSDNDTIRRITPNGDVTTVAGLPGAQGNVDGKGTQARLFYPNGVAFDPVTNRVVIADTYNHNLRVGSVAAPAVTSFTASPSIVDRAGRQVVLSWNVTDATSLTIDNEIGNRPVSGSVTVSPSQTTTYTLTATGVGGTVTARVTVIVGATKLRAVRH